MSEKPLKASVLIVDDDEDFGLALKRCAEESFTRVDLAGDQDAALEQLGQADYQLVILDLMLGSEPGGLGLCRLLKRDPRWQDMRIMVLSSADVRYGLSIKSYLDDAECLPADDFVDKGTTELDDVIRRARLLVERLDA